MKISLYLMLPIIGLCLMFNCKQEVKSKNTAKPHPVKLEEVVVKEEKVYPQFERTECIKRMKNKIENKIPLVVHLNVPLCDNEHQGIVPVNKSLGNGMSLRTNLYWGAKYGIKSHFKYQKDWQLLQSVKDVDSNILERVVFYKKYPNSAKVYLVADAYRGDRMKASISNLFQAISGINKNTINVSGIEIGINGNADLLLFNGHNGLMDYNFDYIENVDGSIKDVGAIACASHSYFVEHLKHLKGYPLLMTSNLMAPEAYVVEALINAWSTLKPAEQMRQEAGKAYS